MKCSKCGAELTDGIAFCAGCGTSLSDIKKANRSKQLEKGMTFLTALLCVLALGAFVCAGVTAAGYLSDYKAVFLTGASAEKLTEEKQERAELIAALSEKENALQELKRQKELWENAEGEEYEQEIRSCYIAKQEAESAARSFVLSKLSNASYITLPEAEQQKLGELVLDKIIDEASGNAIVAAGVKSAIAAASEEMSLQSIINGAVTGAVEEVPDYVTGELTGKVEDLVGVDVFGVADWISEFMNADDTPVALANSMVTEQRKDVSRVLLLLEKDELSGADMQYMAGVMERIYVRGQELEAAGSSAGGDFSGAEQLQKLAELWAENNYRILQYAGEESVNYEG